jgi:hypothetical protein
VSADSSRASDIRDARHQQVSRMDDASGPPQLAPEIPGAKRSRAAKGQHLEMAESSIEIGETIGEIRAVSRLAQRPVSVRGHTSSLRQPSATS